MPISDDHAWEISTFLYDCYLCPNWCTTSRTRLLGVPEGKQTLKYSKLKRKLSLTGPSTVFEWAIDYF